MKKKNKETLFRKGQRFVTFNDRPGIILHRDPKNNGNWSEGKDKRYYVQFDNGGLSWIGADLMMHEKSWKKQDRKLRIEKLKLAFEKRIKESTKQTTSGDTELDRLEKFFWEVKEYPLKYYPTLCQK